MFKTYQHCRWKDDGHWSQHSRSPPSLHASQESRLTVLVGLRYIASLAACLRLESSDCGGAINAWISYGEQLEI